MKNDFGANRKTRRRGVAAVEMALLFPILLVMTFAAIEYGWMFLKQQQVTNAARQGARVAATPSATSTSVKARIDTLMSAAGFVSGNYDVAITPANFTTVTPGSPVTVTVTLYYSQVALTKWTSDKAVGVNSNGQDGRVWIPTPNTLTSAVIMGKEGP